MTCLASFGPVFIAAALPVAYFVIKIYKTLVTIKNYEVKTYTHTTGPNDASSIIWAHFRCSCPPCDVFQHYNLQNISIV